jgi:hypothetical protein
MRRLLVRTAVAATAFALASAAPASAQLPTSSIEITPLVGYVFGGGFNTDGFSGVPDGKLTLESNVGYGVEVGFTPNGSTWFELTYLRQSTDITFKPQGGGACASGNCSAGFATNYIHGGARFEFGQKKIHPFLGFGLGVTIFDPSTSGLSTETDFSISAEGGVRYMFGKAQRFGLRGTFRGWFTFVPNGSYSGWCTIYGYCYAAENSSTVTQGEISGGLVITF